MKKFIPYLIFGISILIFIYALVFLKPIESIAPVDNDPDIQYVFENFDTIGLEGKEDVSKIYEGEITLDRIWIQIKIIFNGYLPDVLNSNLSLQEYFNDNIDDIKIKFGINNYDEFEKLVSSFKSLSTSNMSSAVLTENSIKKSNDGISFKMVVKNIDNVSQEYDFIIYNITHSDKSFYKILPTQKEEEVN